jgi:hypothetical protein
VLEFALMSPPFLPAKTEWPSVLRMLAVATVYWVMLWRLLKDNRGNRVIQLGSTALAVFFVLLVAVKFTRPPDWVLHYLGLFLFTLCILTLWFVLLRVVHALRRKPSIAKAHDTGGRQAQ